jgi:hypothetical protein
MDFTQVFTDRLGKVIREGNPNFFHDPGGQWMDSPGIEPGAENFEQITGKVPEKCFGHLASCGIPCAQE